MLRVCIIISDLNSLGIPVWLSHEICVMLCVKKNYRIFRIYVWDKPSKEGEKVQVRKNAIRK
jgi:hypothetical protein